MKLLLFLEHRFYYAGDNVYCERIINYKYLKRYLNVFDEVTVCARFGKTVPDKKILASGSGVNFLPLPDFMGSNGLAKEYINCCKIIKNNIKNYDAVIIRSPSPISVIAYPIVKKSRLPFAVEIVINPQTLFSKDSYPSKMRLLMSAFFVHHTRQLCMNANGVSYVTEHVLQKLYPCKAMLTNDKRYFTEHYSSIDLRKDQCSSVFHVHEEGKPFIIAHTGYMDSYSKGHLIVMDVAKTLLDNNVPVEIHFIGTGTLENDFKKYAYKIGISNSVVFCGGLNGYPEVQKELAKADLFLFPTCSEGLPRSLIEAMANNVACISSPVDGITELLPPEYLANYKDRTAIYKICIKLLKDDSLRKKAADICFERAQGYTSDLLDARRSSFYRKLYELAKNKERLC